MQIRHGEAVGIIGPSGTGKSTILKIIAGLLAPDTVIIKLNFLLL
jgi:phospholipid/cholesterol/gamma-HCH transport system ATP-binding protein